MRLEGPRVGQQASKREENKRTRRGRRIMATAWQECVSYLAPVASPPPLARLELASKTGGVGAQSAGSSARRPDNRKLAAHAARWPPSSSSLTSLEAKAPRGSERGDWPTVLDVAAGPGRRRVTNVSGQPLWCFHSQVEDDDEQLAGWPFFTICRKRSGDSLPRVEFTCADPFHESHSERALVTVRVRMAAVD